MKYGIAVMCVVLAFCVVVGMAYAQEKGPRKGPEGPNVKGKVKAVDTKASTITVTVKKEEAEKDMTFAVVTEGEGKTQIFVGREAKTLADVTVGANVMVAYRVADAVNTARVIRVMTGERPGGGKREGGDKR